MHSVSAICLSDEPVIRSGRDQNYAPGKDTSRFGMRVRKRPLEQSRHRRRAESLTNVIC